jgi:hypothetical protein
MRFQIALLGVLLTAVSCSSPEPGPVLTSGIWRVTRTYDAGQGQTTNPITDQIFELNFAAGTVVGWRYACDQNWIKCAPKGYGLALTGTVSKGAADLEFSYKPLSDGATPAKVQITGTFSTGGFVGRFKQINPAPGMTEVGAWTMVWLQSQR